MFTPGRRAGRWAFGRTLETMSTSSNKKKTPAATGGAPNAGGTRGGGAPQRNRGGGTGGNSRPQITNARNADQEAVAIMNCLEALKPLNPDARQRVMGYVGLRYKIAWQEQAQGENAGIETVAGGAPSGSEGARTWTQGAAG